MATKPREISDAKARSTKIVFKESFDSGFEYGSAESKTLILKKKLEFYAELYTKMPNQIGRTINYLLNELKMSKIKLANEADINRKMVFKIISGQMTIHVEPMVQMCIGLHVPYFISSKLIELSGHELRVDLEEHRYYIYVLMHKHELKIEQVREELAKFKIYSL